MKATQVLPPNYHPSGKFDLKSMKQIIILNLVGLVILIFSILFFGWLANLSTRKFSNLLFVSNYLCFYSLNRYWKIIGDNCLCFSLT